MVLKKINITLFKPEYPRFNILNSHLEVIGTLLWGFNTLGVNCTFRTNEIDSNCVNIVFGWEIAFYLINMGRLEELPNDTILYNLEQYSTYNLKDIEICMRCAKKYQIWDYSTGNIKRWKELQPKYEPYYAKISFAPSLLKIPHAVKEDIDIAYVGSIGSKRAETLFSCGGTLNRNSVIGITNMWGEQRDEFISRAKILLNLSGGLAHMKIFEIVRVSYYLANKKAVICELVPGAEIEEDLSNILKLIEPNNIGAACDELLKDSENRKKYAEECYEVFRERDIRNVISNFFNMA